MINLSENQRLELRCSLSILLREWRRTTEDHPILMFLHLGLWPELDMDPDFNWAVGHVQGMADGLGMSIEDMLCAWKQDWDLWCAHDALLEETEPCPDCIQTSTRNQMS